MNLKRFGASTLAAVMAMSMMGTAFAADATLQDDMTGQGNMEVVGTVKPITMIDVTLPVNGMQFTINADRTIRFNQSNPNIFFICGNARMERRRTARSNPMISWIRRLKHWQNRECSLLYDKAWRRGELWTVFTS